MTELELAERLQLKVVLVSMVPGQARAREFPAAKALVGVKSETKNPRTAKPRRSLDWVAHFIYIIVSQDAYVWYYFMDFMADFSALMDFCILIPSASLMLILRRR